MVTSKHLVALVLWVLVAAVPLACRAPGEVTRAPIGRSTITISSDGSVLKHEDCVKIEVPPGALPEGAALSIERAPPPELPAGTTPVGNFYKIAASHELTSPVTLGLPIPASADRARLALYRFGDDGSRTVIDGTVEA